MVMSTYERLRDTDKQLTMMIARETLYQEKAKTANAYTRSVERQQALQHAQQIVRAVMESRMYVRDAIKAAK